MKRTEHYIADFNREIRAFTALETMIFEGKIKLIFCPEILVFYSRDKGFSLYKNGNVMKKFSEAFTNFKRNSKL